MQTDKMSAKKVILFVFVCRQGNCDGKNYKNLRAYVQISLKCLQVLALFQRN